MKEFNKAFAEQPNFYNTYTIRYLEAMDDSMRKASKEHWLKCHAENLASGREDLIIFSGKILAAIAIAEEIISNQ